jgi:hypothetical protein
MAHCNSLRRHRSLLGFAKDATLEVASEDARRPECPGGIIPFRWAASSRYDGRHHSVTVGGIISFWWATSIGISTQLADIAESGATRTPIPVQGGQHSGDYGQRMMAA